MTEEVFTGLVIAIVTGIVTGVFSSVNTITSLRVHIDYIRASIDKHDERLLEVEKEQHRIAGAVGVAAENGG